MEAEILVVDDTKIERFFLQRLLEKLGRTVDGAESGEQALSMLSKSEYRLVFWDEKMPGQADGRETVMRLQEENHTPPIVLLGEKNENPQTDGIIVLKKPVEYRRLTEVLQKFLSLPVATEAESPLPDGELDTALGIHNCGSEEGYREALEIYYRTIPDKADEIERFLADGDIASYTIKVHALKSSSLIVGATELSELAKELEQAGKVGDTETIGAKTGQLLADYRHYREVLAPLFADDDAEDGELIPSAVLEDAYASLAEFAETMDVDMAEMVLVSMKEYRLPEEDEAIMRDISEALLALDWEKIMTLARQKL